MRTMDSLTIYQLRNRSQAHFGAVGDTDGIDRFCSSLDWILPAHEAFIPDHPLYLRESEHGFVTLARGFNPRIGRYLQPLEASWCLACPIVGSNPAELVKEFAEEFRLRDDEWDLLYLSGIPQGSVIFRELVRQFHASHRIGLGHKTRRYVASLEGGSEGFLSRRSSKFRANLRRSRRLADDEGVTYDYLDDITEEGALDVYQRILAVEERSWKGKNGTGILDGGMNDFYRIMLPRLARRDALRVLFASSGGDDIAYVFGGLLDGSYRGLQLSYDEDYRKLSPGNLVQLAIIEHLCEEGIESYDLGSELDYKARWAESRLETITMWVWNDH
jgi:hypothetical protein